MDNFTKKPSSSYKSSAAKSSPDLKLSTGYQKASTASMLVIDRFNTYCKKCGKNLTAEIKTCPKCKTTFTTVATSYTCGWMQTAIQALRPDLKYVSPTDAFSDAELHL